MLQTNFLNETCNVVIEEGYNGTKRIQLYDLENLPFATASVDLEGLDSDEFAIKDYSENTGILKALIEDGIVEKPHRYLHGRFVNFAVVRLSETTTKSEVD